MPARRRRGDGSVYRRRDRDLWAASVVDPGPPRRRVVRYAATEKEALRLARELARARDQRRLPAGGRTTVAEYLAAWLADVAPATVAPGSLADYESKIRLYVLPAVGSLRVDRLTTPDLRALDAGLAARGLSIATRRKTMSVVRAALADLVADGTLPRNPATFRMPSPPRGKAGAALTLDEARAVLDEARGDPLEARWYAALLGLRQGEALRLRWGHDLTLDPAAISIVRSKSDASERTLPLPPELAAPFRRRWAHAQVERATAGDRYTDHGLVFARPDGRPLDPRADYQAWVDLLAAAGVRRVRLHDARHTAATLLLRAGVDLPAIRGWIGHSQITLTVETYGHLDSGALGPAAGVLGQLLAGED